MKTDRLVSIIMILLEKERVSAQELADMFEVSLRTIYRDMDAINLSGIPVCAKSGAGGGFEILPEYKVDKKVFSADELLALLMGSSGCSALGNRRFTTYSSSSAAAKLCWRPSSFSWSIA